MPRFSLLMIIILLIVYIVGARYPQLAQKIGAA
jgi:hypothetical protein